MMEVLDDEQIVRRTDTQNFGGYNVIPSPLFLAGIKNWSAVLIQCAKRK